MLAACGAGGVGVAGFLGPYRGMAYAAGGGVLALAFYLSVIRRPTRANVAIFALALVAVGLSLVAPRWAGARAPAPASPTPAASQVAVVPVDGLT